MRLVSARIVDIEKGRVRNENEYKLLAQNGSTGYGLGKFNESFLNATNESA